MLERIFIEVYNKFKYNFYKNIFNGYDSNSTSMTVTESFTSEAIYSLNSPTITELSDYLGISQPNTTYKVNELIQKGYVEKKRDPKDRRRVKLYSTDKLNSYCKKKNQYVMTVVKRIRNTFTEDEIDTLERMLNVIVNELMPESHAENKTDNKTDNKKR